MSVDIHSLVKPYYIGFEYKARTEKRKKFIIQAPDDLDFSQLDFLNPNLSTHEALLFLSQLSEDFQIGTHASTKDGLSRSILYKGEKKIQLHYSKSSNKTTFRYFGDFNSDIWHYIQTFSSYNIYLFISNISEEQLLQIIDNKQFSTLHPYRAFVKYIYKQDKTDLYTKAQLKDLIKKSTKNMYVTKAMFKDGYIKINTTNNLQYVMKYKNDDGSIENIHSLIYLVPEFKQIIDMGKVIELDCSFFVLRPYVYCIPVLIINNESVPIGLVIGPSEKKEIYSMLYNYIQDIDPNSFIKIKSVPLLSDQGSALLAFSREFNLDHYFCLRHILNKFGASSKLCGIIKPLLFSRSYSDFIYLWNIQKDVIINELRNSPEKRINQFSDLFGVKFTKEESNLSIPSNENLKQCVWNRIDKSIPTCSNHAESIHSHLNQSCSNLRSFPLRINEILNLVRNKISTFHMRRNLNEKINQIKKASKNLTNTQCHCKQDTYIDSLYGVHIPCVHEVKNFKCITLTPIKKSNDFLFEKNEYTDTEWNFPQINSFPDYIKSGDEGLLILFYGKPDIEKINFLVSVANIEDKNKKALRQYIKSVFVTFCSFYYGFYNYSENSIKCFNSYFRNIWFSENNSYDMDYSLAERNSNIKILEELIDEIDVTQVEQLEIKKNEKEERTLKKNEVSNENIPRETTKKQTKNTTEKSKKKILPPQNVLALLQKRIVTCAEQNKDKEPLKFLEIFFAEINKKDYSIFLKKDDD